MDVEYPFTVKWTNTEGMRFCADYTVNFKSMTQSREVGVSERDVAAWWNDNPKYLFTWHDRPPTPPEAQAAGGPPRLAAYA